MTSTERCDEIIALIDRVLIETETATETTIETGPAMPLLTGLRRRADRGRS